jgi:hypothetical protein
MVATTRQVRTAVAGERLMTVTEFGDRIGVPRATAYRIVAAGQIDCTNVSTGTQRPRIRISEAAYKRYIAAREIKGRGVS